VANYQNIKQSKFKIQIMKVKFLVMAFTLASLFSYSQEVKVKKGEIQVNGKSVAKIEKKDKVYSISDLSGKTLFTAAINNKTPLNNLASKSWIQLVGNNGNVREVALDKSGGFTFSNEKYISENLILNVKKLFPDTVSEEAVNDFFQTEDRSISKAEDLVIEKEKQIAKSEDSIAKVNKLTFDKVGIISANNQKIGYILRKSNGKDVMQEYLSYTVLDINKIPVAEIQFSSMAEINAKNGLVIKTVDGKNFPLTRTNYTSALIESDDLAKRVVHKLYANGYTLGDMKSMVQIAGQENADAIKQQNKEMEDRAKADSKNIYGTGYVIDKNGNKKEGTITMEFESISAKLGKEKNVSDLTSYGTFVQLTSNGKTETFKAKDGVKFCAGDRCFLGANGSEDSGTGNSSGSQLGAFGESLFFEILAEKEGNYVLNFVKNPQYYYLKLAGQPKAIYLGDKAGFGTKKPEKIKKLFDEYVSCAYLDFFKYDTKTKEGLVQVLVDYSVQCKK
jgi:hypothetical protein